MRENDPSMHQCIALGSVYARIYSGSFANESSLNPGPCFGWEDLSITWSSKVIAKLPDSLAEHLKFMISQEASCNIPDTPPTNLPMCKPLLILGKLSKDVILMDKSCSENDHTFKSSAKTIRDERESCRYSEWYIELQQVSIPKIGHKLVSKKIEILFEMIEPNNECVLHGVREILLLCQKVIII